jgi:phage-related baseplate assembly protein
MSLPIPNFINRDPNIIVTEMVADYELRTGKVLEPAQIERLLINAYAYREGLIRNQIQDASLQNLLEYARFPMLDHLGVLLGVERLPSQSAQTTLLLTLVGGHGDLVIPQGLRVSSTDGRAVFELIQDYTVLTGTDTVSVTAIAQNAGKGSNNYDTGTVSVILDPQAYLSSALNTTVSTGGSDEETDEQLRDRIKLAPSAFSNAGSYKAYEFWAKSTSPTIIDVAVDNKRVTVDDEPPGLVIGDPIPGTVEVFPLVEGLSVTPPEILNAVEAVLNADKIRPLTDTVYVSSPEAVDTVITIELVLYDGAVSADILLIVESNLEAFRDGRRKLLGQDIIIDQIKALSVIDGVYKSNVILPDADVVIGKTEFANITAINVSVSGTNEG